MIDNSTGADVIGSSQVVFGSPEFCTKVFAANKAAFEAFSSLADVANALFSAADDKAEKDFEKAVYLLTRLTLFGLNDAIVLAVNGSGTGAMKIVRGMFETSALAEYLRINPVVAGDYVEFGRVTAWRRYQWQLSNAPATALVYSPEQIKEIEDGYDGAKDRFTDSKGRVRNQWTSCSIREIATAIGRAKQYETVYSLCCSLHHASFEGLSGYAEMKNGVATFDGPPSMAWTSEALRSAHSYSVLTLNTLNECCHLGLDEKVKEVGNKFIDVWKKK